MADRLKDPSARAIARIAPLLGERVLVLHGPSAPDEESTLSGRDVDCLVSGIDPMWPLRLSRGWTLGQSLHYDLRGWYWVIVNDHVRLALDTIDDPSGLGRDGLRTDEVLKLVGNDVVPLRAAYLAVKRVRKHSRSEGEWHRIGTLARQDADGFERALVSVVGDRMAEVLRQFALAGTPPDAETIRRANSLRLARRFSSPPRLARAVMLGARRYLWRIQYPTGLLVVIAGPDGTGKSTLADQLPRACAGMFKRSVQEHWRPGVLPRPGAFLARRPSDPSAPHAREPYGRVASTLLLGYYWLDFLLGGWLLEWPMRLRTGLVVRERGWWDVAVDPRRYRLQPAGRLARVLGYGLKRPDVLLILEAEPEAVLSRKSELSAGELTELRDRWRRIRTRGVPTAYLDASRPIEDVARAARQHVLAFLEERAVSRLGAGWLALPRGSARWWLPRGPRSVAAAGLGVYQPVTAKAKVGWNAALAVARRGGFRLVPRGAAPPKEVRDVLAPHLPPGGTMAVARGNAPGGFVASILDRRGDVTAIAKVALEPGRVQALVSEAAAIRSMGALLPAPLSAPGLLLQGPGLLLLEAVLWRPRQRPWKLDEEVAYALGSFFGHAMRDIDGEPSGPAHGDFAPWNLLMTDQGWTLVDWESAIADAPPFFDLCHWMIQSHALLGRPSQSELVEGSRSGRGWIGQAIRAYAEGAGVDASIRSAFRAYMTLARISPAANRHESRALERRRLVLDVLGA